MYPYRAPSHLPHNFWSSYEYLIHYEREDACAHLSGQIWSVHFLFQVFIGLDRFMVDLCLQRRGHLGLYSFIGV
jgi:hypothetical protein